MPSFLVSCRPNDPRVGLDCSACTELSHYVILNFLFNLSADARAHEFVMADDTARYNHGCICSRRSLQHSAGQAPTHCLPLNAMNGATQGGTKARLGTEVGSCV